MKHIKIIIPIFGTYLTIHEAENWDGINEKYNIDLDSLTYAVVFSHTDADGFVQYVAAFREQPKNSIIAHESVHLVNLLFKTIGAKLDINNDELQAYLTEWFFEQIEVFFEDDRKEIGATFTLMSEEKSWPLKLFTSPRGIRNGDKRPDTVVIDCYEIADSRKLEKITEYLHEIRSAMQ